MTDLARGQAIIGACGVMLERFLQAYADEELDDLIAYLASTPGWEPFLAMARKVRHQPTFEFDMEEFVKGQGI